MKNLFLLPVLIMLGGCTVDEYDDPYYDPNHPSSGGGSQMGGGDPYYDPNRPSSGGGSHGSSGGGRSGGGSNPSSDTPHYQNPTTELPVPMGPGPAMIPVQE